MHHTVLSPSNLTDEEEESQDGGPTKGTSSELKDYFSLSLVECVLRYLLMWESVCLTRIFASVIGAYRRVMDCVGHAFVRLMSPWG